jgi:hypothetical protein
MAMGVQIRLFFVILILINMGSNSELVAAQNSSNLRSDRIQISYVQRWSRLSEQNLRIDKWSVCRG